MELSKEATAEKLKNAQKVLILTHRNPDGDTIGSGFALYRGLKALGKRAAVLCSDPIPRIYSFFTEETPFDFSPDLIVAVDIADPQLLGDRLSVYAAQVDLCIDHHISNTRYAKDLCLDEKAAATAEILLPILKEMGVAISSDISVPLYTGIATDTGCFRFSNTTSATHHAAAELIESGADHIMVNRLMFETKSRARIQVEQAAILSMRFFLEDRCAMIVIPRELIERSGVDESELEGISAMPRQIEGVEVGITLREKEDSEYKVSVRTVEPVSAAEICKTLGGGGHARAAGCTLKGPLDEVEQRLLDAIRPYL